MRGTDLGVLVVGFRLLLRRPASAFVLLWVGILLGGVGPLLQRWTGRNDDAAYMILGMVGMLPWELYFLPRFLVRLDAEERGHPRNPMEGWQVTFEQRWFLTLVAKMALNLAVAFGLIALVVPGLLVLFCFGWTPYRVLLRGESLAIAMRGSLAMMRAAWRRALLMVGAAFLLAFCASLGLAVAASAFHPARGPLPLTSPLRWIVEAASVAISLWLSATLLAAFHRIEPYSDPEK